MKPEKVVAIWVCVLLACVAWLSATLIPWPEKLREPWGAGDWAAWIQAAGSIAAIFGSAWIARYQMARQVETDDLAATQMRRHVLLQELRLFQALTSTVNSVFQVLEPQLATGFRIPGQFEAYADMMTRLESASATIRLQELPPNMLDEILTFNWQVIQLRSEFTAAAHAGLQLDAFDALKSSCRHVKPETERLFFKIQNTIDAT